MTIDERIQAYIDEVPPCVEGQGGDTKLFTVACNLQRIFRLNEDQLVGALEKYNEKCVPPWPDSEHHRLVHKAREAMKVRKLKEGLRVTVQGEQKPIAVYSRPDLTMFTTAKTNLLFPPAPSIASIPTPPLRNKFESGVVNVVKMIPPNPCDFWALDIETFADVKLGKRGKPIKSKDALDAWKGHIRLVNLCDSAGRITTRDLLDGPLTWGELPVFEPLIAHHAAFDLRFLGRLCIFPTRVFCTMTASKLVHPYRQVSHKLEDLLSRYLGVHIEKGLGASDWGGELTEEQLEYARNDVRHLHRLKEMLEIALEKAGLQKVFELESNLIPVITQMELHGFAVDVEEMARMRGSAESSSLELADEVRRLLDDSNLNPASPSQLVKKFNAVGIAVDNVDEETLKRMDHPAALGQGAAKAILAFRSQAKLASNIQSLLESVHDGRIHSIFQPFGTTTGRFSSKDPNLQNVTRGPLRACFIPSPGHKLIVADYSQIELRVAAHIARDEVMLEAFRSGEDLHMKIVQEIYNGKATKEDRHKGKAINFGFIYGQGAEGFVRYARTSYDLILTFPEAEQFRSKFFGLYTGLASWHSSNWKKVHDGVNASHTVFGRRLLAENDSKWSRFCLLTNYVVQGSCADLIKAAMLKAVSILPANVHLIATVHDELIFDAPAERAHIYCAQIHQAMLSAFVEMFGTTVPVEVEAKVCNHWGDK